MNSINAENVAKAVGKAIREGRLVNLKQIQKDNGYSEKSAHTMKAIKTQTYQKAILKFVPLLENEIAKIQLEMASRDISKERYTELARVLDIIYKNKQLATGGHTGNETIVVNISEAIANKHGIKS